MNTVQVERRVDPEYLDGLETERARIWRDAIVVSLVFGICIGIVVGWLLAMQAMTR